MIKTSLRRVPVLLSAVVFCFSFAAFGQGVPKIKSITADQSFYSVLGPDHIHPINSYGGLATTSDEHSTIFPPGTLPFQSNYLFLVAARTSLAPEASGLVLLTNISMPDHNGQWTMDFAPFYGLFAPQNLAGQRNAAVFVTAMSHLNCPPSTGNDWPDATFDLNYAAPASAFVDPTNPFDQGGGNLVLVYEGTHRCIGLSGASNAGNNFFSTIGVATSKDFGYTWPTYRANFTPLPGINPTTGPNAPLGAWGNQVCWGNFCPSINLLQPPAQYGRYAISGPVETIADAFTDSTTIAANGLAGNAGDSEPAAFVDDVHGSWPPYVYVVHTYNPGPFSADSPLYQNFSNVGFDLSVSRFALNGGTARMQATHWFGKKFLEAGLPGPSGGGHQDPIFPSLHESDYQNCLAPSQTRSAASISYSDSTHEYVLFFVCLSPTEPAPGSTYVSGDTKGGAWFYSTIDADLYDLSSEDQWSLPTEVVNSWSPFIPNGGCGKDFNGWYPSLMSLGARPGHLGTSGFIFYMDGCTDKETTGGRIYSSRAFTIQAQ
jgi:hypothetical protein